MGNLLSSKMKLNIPDSDAGEDNQVFTVTHFLIHKQGVTESEYEHFDNDVPQCKLCIGDEKLMAPYQSKDIFVFEVDSDERYADGQTTFHICSRCKNTFKDFYKSARPVGLYQVQIKWPSKL